MWPQQNKKELVGRPDFTRGKLQLYECQPKGWQEDYFPEYDCKHPSCIEKQLESKVSSISSMMHILTIPSLYAASILPASADALRNASAPDDQLEAVDTTEETEARENTRGCVAVSANLRHLQRQEHDPLSFCGITVYKT